MILNLGAKSFFTGALVTGLIATIYSFTTSDYAGAVLLLVATGALVVLGAAACVATGTGERFSDAAFAQPAADRPTIAPFVVALGAGVFALGAAIGTPAVVAGLVVAAIGGLMWFSNTWQGHPSHVARINTRVADRFSIPFGMPLAMIGLILVIGVSMSRTFLAVSKNAATVISIIVAGLIFIGGLIWMAKPSNKVLVRLLTAVAVVSVAAMFTAGQIAGEREFHHPGAEHGEEHSEGGHSEEGKTESASE